MKPFCLPIATIPLILIVALAGCRSTRKGNAENRLAAVGGAAPQSYQGSVRIAKRNSYSSVSTSAPVLALTYDDGPHPQNTPRLLNILRSRNVKATFYVTGENAKKYPDILRRMVAEGHEIGNHTLTHGRITAMSQNDIRREIHATHQAVKSATGRLPTTFRPPYGATNDQLKAWIKAEFGMPSIMWSVDPEDWKKPGVNVVTNRLVSGASRGGILLLHDIHKSSIDATPATVDKLKAQGYRFITVSQLIALEP